MTSPSGSRSSFSSLSGFSVFDRPPFNDSSFNESISISKDSIDDKSALSIMDDAQEHTVRIFKDLSDAKSALLGELKDSTSELADKMFRLKQTACRLDEMVHRGRVQNAKNRVQNEATLRKLHDYLEADPQIKNEMDRIEKQICVLSNAVLSVHREFYHLDRLYDADDLLHRVQEVFYQTQALEETFKVHEQPLKSHTGLENAARGLMSLANGKEEVQEKAKRLADALNNLVFNGEKK